MRIPDRSWNGWRQLPGWRPLLLVLAVAAVYANSFGGAFLFDDIPNINIAEVKEPFPLGRLLNGTRPVAVATFAVNYAVGELEVWGYHAVNVGVHAAAALLLYGLVRRTLELPRFGGRYDGRAANVALAAALVWAVHPLNTQAVTYIVQRMESLMGMFYLLTLYALNRGATAAGRGGAAGWYAVAVAASALGMGSKQVGATIPVVALLYDRCFLAGTFSAAVARRWWLYPALATGFVVFLTPTLRNLTLNIAGAAPIPVVAPAEGAIVGQAFRDPTAWEYARTQPGVILYYLRLAVWPRPLCLDYAWEVADGPGDVIAPAAVVAVLALATVWALWRRPAIGFLGAAFFLILAPTSSFVPITDLMFEHRMYLPLAAVVVLAVAGADSALRRAGANRAVAPGLVAAVVLVFGALTVTRNEDYRTDTGMWRDVVTKRPDNPRGRFNLGVLLFKDQKWDEAVPELEAVDRLGSNHPMPGVDLGTANNNLGTMYVLRGRTAEAVERYRTALRYLPGNPEISANLASALIDVGQTSEAEAVCRSVLAAQPDAPAALRGMGKLLARRGDYAEAVGYYERAAALGDPLADNGLAVALRRLGRYDEALIRHRAAITSDPTNPDRHNHLGLTLLMAGRPAEAVPAFREAVRLAPRDPRYRGNLAAALDAAGLPADAEREYRAAVESARDWPLRAGRAAWELATSPDPGARHGPEAVIVATQVDRVTGGQDPTALDILAAAYAAVGKYPEATAAAKRAVARAELIGRRDLADDIHARLKLYEGGRPYVRVVGGG